MRETV